jgi:hypothetical protein
MYNKDVVTTVPFDGLIDRAFTTWIISQYSTLPLLFFPLRTLLSLPRNTSPKYNWLFLSVRAARDNMRWCFLAATGR